MCDGLGLPISLDSPFMRKLYDRADQVCDNIYISVQEYLIDRVHRKTGGELELIEDGTFSQTGHNSQDQSFTDHKIVFLRVIYFQYTCQLSVTDRFDKSKYIILHIYGFVREALADCFVTIMARFPGDRKPRHIACHYGKRYTSIKTNPKPGVFTCSAQKLEPIGVEQALKDILIPKHGLFLKSINADGDTRTKKTIETCVWNADDVQKRGIDESYIGKNVVDYPFEKKECWSHMKKNIPKKLEGIFRDLDLFGTQPAQFSKSKSLYMSRRIQFELGYEYN